MSALPDGNQELSGTIVYPDLNPDSLIYSPKTMRIVSTDRTAGFIIINVSDFNAGTMTLYVG